MSKKFNNWLRIWILGLIFGTILAAVIGLIAASNQQSSYALFLTKIFGSNLYLAYIVHSIFTIDLIWTILLVIIKHVFDKFNTKNVQHSIQELPLVKISTKVILKNIDRISDYDILASQYALVPVYNITFEASDGRRFAFQTNQNVYNQILENDTGILTYKENNGQLIFINFERQIQPSQ